jgi:hypothetical protein
MNTHKSVCKIIWIVMLIMVLSASCENDELKQESVPSPIPGYISSTPSVDSVFSSIKYLKPVNFGSGNVIAYDNKLFSFSLIDNIADINIYDISTNQVTYKEYHLDFKLTIDPTFIYTANKVLFAGGNKWKCKGNECWGTVEIEPNFVVIYDRITDQWSTSGLSTIRSGYTAASLGNLVFFAGGLDTGTNYASKVVDIYNTTTDKWYGARLSIPRYDIAAGSAGDKVLFAGGNTNWTNNEVGDLGMTDRVDIYDASTGKWSIDHLSSAKAQMMTASCGNKVYFISGCVGGTCSNPNVIDVYDANSGTWSTILMTNPKFYNKCIAAGNLIFFTEQDYKVKSIDMFNTLTGVWSTLPTIPLNPQGYSSPHLGVVAGNKLFLSDAYDTYMFELK